MIGVFRMCGFQREDRISYPPPCTYYFAVPPSLGCVLTGHEPIADSPRFSRLEFQLEYVESGIAYYRWKN